MWRVLLIAVVLGTLLAGCTPAEPVEPLVPLVPLELLEPLVPLVPPVSGPLESPFDEIIPEDLGLFSYSGSEETTHHTSGIVSHSRSWGNRAAFASRFPEDEKPQGGSVVFMLVINAYQDEEQAQEYLQEQIRKRSSVLMDSAWIAWNLELLPGDVIWYMQFWREPGEDVVIGEERILFRVGKYVGNYLANVDDPPGDDEDGFYMDIDVSNLLHAYVANTDVARLRSLQFNSRG